jgi:uncharacterized membrane protein YeiH
MKFEFEGGNSLFCGLVYDIYIASLSLFSLKCAATTMTMTMRRMKAYLISRTTQFGGGLMRDFLLIAGARFW